MLFTSCFLSRRPHHLYFYKSQHHVQVFRLLSNFFLSMYPIFYCPVLPPWQAGVEEGGTGRELYSSASMSRCVMEMRVCLLAKSSSLSSRGYSSVFGFCPTSLHILCGHSFLGAPYGRVLWEYGISGLLSECHEKNICFLIS